MSVVTPEFPFTPWWLTEGGFDGAATAAEATSVAAAGAGVEGSLGFATSTFPEAGTGAEAVGTSGMSTPTTSSTTSTSESSLEEEESYASASLSASSAEVACDVRWRPFHVAYI